MTPTSSPHSQQTQTSSASSTSANPAPRSSNCAAIPPPSTASNGTPAAAACSQAVPTTPSSWSGTSSTQAVAPVSMATVAGRARSRVRDRWRAGRAGTRSTISAGRLRVRLRAKVATGWVFVVEGVSGALSCEYDLGVRPGCCYLDRDRRLSCHAFTKRWDERGVFLGRKGEGVRGGGD